MAVVEEDRRLLYRKLYKGRRSDLEIHTRADVADVYHVYAPIWGQWGKVLWTYPDEMIRKRRSRTSLNLQQSAFLARLNQAQVDMVDVVPDTVPLSSSSPKPEGELPPALSDHSLEQSIAELRKEDSFSS